MLCALVRGAEPVRYILISHPTLERVVGRIIGRDEFHMQILNTESATSTTDLIAGLFARVAELQGDHFRAVAGELNAFLAPTREAYTSRMPTI